MFRVEVGHTMLDILQQYSVVKLMQRFAQEGAACAGGSWGGRVWGRGRAGFAGYDCALHQEGQGAFWQ